MTQLQQQHQATRDWGRRCRRQLGAQPSSCRPVRVRAGRWSQTPGGVQETVQGSCYEDIVAALAQRALATAQALPPGQVHVVGIAGSPGSGKSTLAQLVNQQINSLAQQQGLSRGAAVVPMDGFHLYKAQLDQMPDPQEAYARRGAPWTFDADKFLRAVQRIKQQGSAALPSFDHAVGDPIENDVCIDASKHSIVLVEGNYLFLQEHPWRRLQDLFDDTWFCDVAVEEAMQRVWRRQTAIGLSPEQSRQRIATNDRPNAILVNESKHIARVLVPSGVPLHAV